MRLIMQICSNSGDYLGWGENVCPNLHKNLSIQIHSRKNSLHPQNCLLRIKEIVPLPPLLMFLLRSRDGFFFSGRNSQTHTHTQVSPLNEIKDFFFKYGKRKVGIFFSMRSSKHEKEEEEEDSFIHTYTLTYLFLLTPLPPAPSSSSSPSFPPNTQKNFKVAGSTRLPIKKGYWLAFSTTFFFLLQKGR